MSLVENFRAAFLVASTATATGISTVLNLIPTDIGKLASVLGVVLTSVLIFVHVSRELRERQKAALEHELLRRQLAEQDGD